MGLLGWTSMSEESVPTEECVFSDHSDAKLSEMELQQKHIELIKQFRQRVQDKIPNHMLTDSNLLRWLVARNFNVAKAEDMLLKSVEWRKEWQVDSILEWNPPDVLKNYYAAGMSGYGKDGSPVIIIPYGSSDVRGMLHCCSKRDFIRYTIHILELSMDVIKKKSEEMESPITKEIFIFDLENFSFREFTWKPALEVVLQLVQMYEANYPEIMKIALVVNAPKVFSFAFNMIKPFINEATLKKIKIFGKNGWQQIALQHICPDQLPVNWGGTMTDPNGDPKCPSKICVGGKVPRELYLDANELKLNGHLKSLILPKAGKKAFEIEVESPETDLRWTFQSEDYDVGFEIKLITSSGKEEVVVPYQRVNSHIVPEEGSVKCSSPGLYKIIFDNHYSFLRSKKLHYSLELSPPSSDREE